MWRKVTREEENDSQEPDLWQLESHSNLSPAETIVITTVGHSAILFKFALNVILFLLRQEASGLNGGGHQCICA
jgi:hypothetical protein